MRIQAIRTNLTQADAAATNAFLVGGLEPPATRAAYLAGLAGATPEHRGGQCRPEQ